MNSTLFDPEIPNCPLCYSDTIAHKYTITKYENAFVVSVCHTCGFLFMNPPFKDSTINSMYNEEYYNGTANYSYYDERKVIQYSEYLWSRRIDTIHTYIKSGNFLDIGCSFAGLLEQASKYYTPYGIELSSYAANYARKSFGNNIHCGTIADHPFAKNFFSVISMIELIEHTKDPLAILKECFDLLQPGGLLVIQTANMAGLQAKILQDNYAYFMPGHLSYFTRKNLAMALKKIGFSKIRVFYPVEFGLVPKLLKSRSTFQSIWDYRKWMRITWYHLISKVHLGNVAMTSSMVMYAFK